MSDCANGKNLGATVSLANSGLTITTHKAGDKLVITAWDGGAPGDVLWGSTTQIFGGALEQTGATEYKYPYMSTLKNNIYGNNFTIAANETWGDGDVFSWIGFVNADSSKSTYATDQALIAQNTKAVVNDAIQNYNDVTFVFNTATKKVSLNAGLDGQWGNPYGTYVDNDWDASDVGDYTSFGRHFWDLDYGYDANTIYVGNDWLGNNLFEGALVINSNLTLSLSATDKFDWTSTSLSFSWDAIQDAALTQNQYANYIQNMVLRTSTTWFWDNMQVVLGETETEDLGEGAPVEGDIEDLPEDEEDDFGFEEDEEEEEQPAVDVEPEPEPEPVAVTTNPGTGNAPVALAVIPVALAAAAVVAKKRG